VQGAALHYLDGENGIKDFDVLILFRENLSISDNSGCLIKIPFRRVGSEDSGMAEFGRYPTDRVQYKSRRVDIMMRELKQEYLIPNDIANSVRNSFRESNTPSIRHWRKKAAIGLWPDAILGMVIWPEA